MWWGASWAGRARPIRAPLCGDAQSRPHATTTPGPPAWILRLRLVREVRRPGEEAEVTGISVAQDWRLWPESYRWLYFRSVARDMFGPDANLQSSLPR